MKRAITLLCGLFTLCGAYAQKKTTIGIHGGYTFYKIHGRNADGSNFSLKTEDGFSLGMNVEFPIAKDVYLQPGIQYNQKGANFDEYHYMGQTFHGDVKLSYIEVPVNIVYKPAVGTGHLIVGQIDDGVILGVLQRYRGFGYDSYLLPQNENLPFANRREDILIVRN